MDKKHFKFAIFILVSLITVFWGNVISVKAEDNITLNGNHYYICKEATKAKAGKVYLTRCTSKKKTIIVPETITYKKNKYQVVGISTIYRPASPYYESEFFSRYTGDVKTEEDYQKAYKSVHKVFENTIEEVVLPKTLTFIGDNAFTDCSKLKSITIPDSVITICNEAFSECYGLKTVTIGKGLEWLGYGAFRSCTSLTELVLPEGLKSIGHSAFWGCINLKNINIPSKLTAIGRYAFADCSSLISIVIPKGVKEISDHAFINCFSLESLIIRNGVNVIGESCFESCFRLKKLELPDSITEIQISAFFQTAGMKEIKLPKKLIRISENMLSESGIENIVIPDTVTEIATEAFSNCGNLRNVKIPDNTKIIGPAAFAWTPLQEIHLPKRLERIDSIAFLDCKLSTGVKLPKSLKKIDKDAFKGSSCTSFMADKGSYAEKFIKKYYPKLLNAKVSKIFDQNYLYIITKKATANTPGMVTLTKSFSKQSEIVIPKEVRKNGEVYKVTAIGDRLFQNKRTIESVILPDSITTIGKEAFYGCSNLKKLLLSRNLIKIGDEAFSYSGLTSITIPKSVTKVGENGLFTLCEKLTSVEILGLKRIDGSMFIGCENLENVVLGEGIEVIGDSSFNSKEKITTIVLPNSLKKIEAYAFYGTGIKEIIILDGVKEIEEDAFDNCPNLIKITVPSSVTKVNMFNFSNENIIFTISPGTYIDEILSKRDNANIVYQ